ncbi:methyltransferase domain-containing protein [Nocardia uniformis]|uniref:Methyltransferase domain-containing protein n=1 Tax=Nocardia uniformis TaxID=53432 RepID=A0A849BUM2_9NOCA|nr:methyltransferase domain-containing protein [Nocardia uniformis]NNH68566.1 methyltransferase domain-containing protein [Nocardia uniformis]
MTGPNHNQALAKYRRIADKYDSRTALLAGLRRRTVEKLDLSAGDVVVDVACGTGANFAQIQERIGPSGRLIGIELSPEMIGQAQRRVGDAGWTNVTLVNNGIERADLPAAPNAFLFSLTHDVLQLPDALAALFRHAEPGARVATGGTKYTARGRLMTDPFVRMLARRFVTTTDGLDRPWRHLERFADLAVRSTLLGGGYIAWGRLQASAD